jgi:hypothetical protein
LHQENNFISSDNFKALQTCLPNHVTCMHVNIHRVPDMLALTDFISGNECSLLKLCISFDKKMVNFFDAAIRDLIGGIEKNKSLTAIELPELIDKQSASNLARVICNHKKIMHCNFQIFGLNNDASSYGLFVEKNLKDKKLMSPQRMYWMHFAPLIAFYRANLSSPLVQTIRPLLPRIALLASHNKTEDHSSQSLDFA